MIVDKSLILTEPLPTATSMQAAVLYGKEDVRLESVPVPHIRAGEILVRVRAALTCGTDVKVFRRGYHARMIQPPALFGHEMAGDVVAVGDAVTRFSVGQRVVAANSSTFAKTCCSTTVPMRNLFVFRNGLFRRTLTKSRPISVIGMRPWLNRLHVLFAAWSKVMFGRATASWCWVLDRLGSCLCDWRHKPMVLE
jgi:hypothetical protein